MNDLVSGSTPGTATATSTTKNRKRKIEKSSTETADEPPLKHYSPAAENVQMHVLLVQNLPCKTPKSLIDPAMSAGLVIGSTGQEMAEILYKTFFGNVVAPSEQEEHEYQQQLEKWMTTGTEIPLNKKCLYIVSDLPGSKGDGDDEEEETRTAPADARVRFTSPELFVVRNFATKEMVPPVAIVVDSSSSDVLYRIQAHIEGQEKGDNRPPELAERFGPTGQIEKVNTLTPNFLRLGDGCAFKEYRP